MRFSCISELDITNAIKNRYGALGKVNYDFFTTHHTFIEK